MKDSSEGKGMNFNFRGGQSSYPATESLLLICLMGGPKSKVAGLLI